MNTCCKINVILGHDDASFTQSVMPIEYATSRAGKAYPPGAHELTPVFLWGFCSSIFSFMYNVL